MVRQDDYRNLSEVIEVLEKVGINYWLSHGTLLGLAREGKILDWDNDIDIAIEGYKAIEFWKMLFNELENMGFRIDYRFNYLLCRKPNEVDLPISLELNWRTDEGFLYIGGSLEERNPGFVSHFVEFFFFRPIMAVLETVPNTYRGKSVLRKSMFYISKFVFTPVFSPDFLQWFSTLVFHDKYRSPYLLKFDIVEPTQEVSLKRVLRARFPSRVNEVLTTMYGTSWISPDPNFDKRLSYPKALGDSIT